jgi:hypothetical protein
MMKVAGFLAIPHPYLRLSEFGTDRFHYTKAAMQKVVKHVVDCYGSLVTFGTPPGGTSCTSGEGRVAASNYLGARAVDLALWKFRGV